MLVFPQKKSNNIMKKCKYFNNHQSACTLMIDDLVPASISPLRDQKPLAKYDWGFYMDNENSLFNYFYDNLLKKYPEIKGTFFLPLTTHKFFNKNSGYSIKTREYDNDFYSFLKRISPNFDYAFHGTSHGKFINKANFEFKNNWIQEFEYSKIDDIKYLQKEIKNFEKNYGTCFTGGKYPGYKKNKYSERIIEELGFLWWADSSEMIGIKHSQNKHSYFGSGTKILKFPTNVPGYLFNNSLSPFVSKNLWFKYLKEIINNYRNEHLLQYLYDNNLIISIQEHFQNQRTDGKRQSQNVYDDIQSLNKIYEILRGTDLWYATCSEISHYLESYDFTDLIKIDNNKFEIIYKGRWTKPFLSISTSSREIMNMTNKRVYKGVYKNGLWIHNNISTGLYKLV